MPPHVHLQLPIFYLNHLTLPISSLHPKKASPANHYRNSMASYDNPTADGFAHYDVAAPPIYVSRNSKGYSPLQDTSMRNQQQPKRESTLKRAGRRLRRMWCGPPELKH